MCNYCKPCLMVPVKPRGTQFYQHVKPVKKVKINQALMRPSGDIKVHTGRRNSLIGYILHNQ